MSDLLDLFDVAETGQLSLAVLGEQMPLDGLARPPREAVDAREPGAELPPVLRPLAGALALDLEELAAPFRGSDA